MIFQHTLLAEFELRGRWRLVDGDRETPGVIRFSPEHGIRLVLDQPLEPALEAVKHTFGPRLAAYDVVQGESLDGNPITLFGVEGKPFGTLRSRLMIVGEALPSERAFLCRGLVAEFEGLEAFVGLNPISGQGDESSETVTYRQPEPFRVELNETYSISIEHRCAWSASFGQRSLEHRASVRVHATMEMSAAEFFNGPLAAFHRLLELAVGQRLRVRSVKAESSRSVRNYGERVVQDHVLLFFRQPPARPIGTTLHPDDLSFNLRSLGSDAPKVIQRWNERYSDLWPVTAFYFLLDPRFDLDTGLELHFLTAISAIEHLHRNTRTGRNRGKSDGLDKQLLDLLGRMPGSVAAVFGNLQQFVTAITSNRSHLLHGQPVSSHHQLAGRELWKVLNGLRLIVFAGLLRQIGLDDGPIEQAATKSTEFRRLEAYRRVEASNG